MSDIKLGNCPFCKKTVAWCGSDMEEPHSCHMIYCAKCDINFDMCATEMGPVEENESNPLQPLQQFCADKFNAYGTAPPRRMRFKDLPKGARFKYPDGVDI